MRRSFYGFMIVLLVSVSTLFGCGKGEKAEEMPVVRYVNFKIYDPTYIGIDKGFYEKEGIVVDMIGDVLAGPTAIQAVAAGSAEVGVSSIAAIINANAAGLPVQGVADLQSTLPNQALQQWYVLKDSPIQSLADVKGTTYAVNLWNSSFHYTTLMGLEQAGVAEEDVDFVLLSFANQITALLADEVDVAGLMQPYQGYIDAEHGDEVRKLWNDFELYGERQVSLIFVNRVWCENQLETCRAYVRGTSAAIDWIEANQDEARGIVAKYTGIDREFVPDYHFTTHGEVRSADIQFWMDFMKERGDLKVDWVTAEMVGTDAYNVE